MLSDSQLLFAHHTDALGSEIREPQVHCEVPLLLVVHVEDNRSDGPNWIIFSAVNNWEIRTGGFEGENDR